ncbi:DUF5682 family protein [Granulicoccus phenolivorans]|uniref:DUF5682 family protein n=1 Tax=Granulicoccus phenolivorans TaxID=266854 RepID=UPI0003F542C5|nr:DUF5682 family protein [Granulicoccus phenolivorans]
MSEPNPTLPGDAAPPGAAEVARVRVLGIRHHGPGSARAVRAALAEYRPELVLIEGPPEADALVPLVADPDLRPPVALLAYAADQPRLSAFWPFAEFSPEWQALRWAVEAAVPVRFMDLPATHTLALQAERKQELLAAFLGEDGESGGEESGDGDDDAESGDAEAGDAEAGAEPAPTTPAADTPEPGAPEPGAPIRTDPIAVLARAAGYDDPERWWDDVIESRTDGDPFEAITEAMAELRAAGIRERDAYAEAEEARREAYMRKVLRTALKTDAARIAVICGAWHAPALTGKLPKVGADNALLKGLPKRKIATTWVPWTHGRLRLQSGYGAGIESPGWYAHLFGAGDRVIERWLIRVAGTLRAHDLPISSAHVIEAVRLTNTLATLRGRPLPGLDEVTEATRSVMCDGSAEVLGLVTTDLVRGEALGTVPETATAVPLEADLRATIKRLRLKQDPTPRSIQLDLRKENDRGKSQLLRRLRILGIAWGNPEETGGLGTFKEGWVLAWDPAFSVDVITASVWGATVADAATAKLVRSADSLAAVTGRIEEALTADLPDALDPLLRTLDELAAHQSDVYQLMDAIPPLVRAQRYGDVRGTDTTALGAVARALLLRVCAGLPAAVGGLGDEAAAAAKQSIDGVQAVLALLPADGAEQEWSDQLLALSERADVHGLLSGRLTRILLDSGRIDVQDAADRLSRALSHGPSPLAKAHWIEGFLSGGALLLIHHQELLPVLDRWVAGLAEEDFLDIVALLRRTFGAFERAERNNIIDRVRSIGAPAAPTLAEHLDFDLAAAALATVRLLQTAGTGEENP